MFNPVKVTDVSLRDGLEDFVLKYLQSEDLARLGSLLDRAGFYSIDCWGGATFYAALTDLKEDPWERLKKLRRALTRTPIQVILRGRMLVGFKPYSDELARRFLTRAAHLGVDIFRVYDSLNDLDNLAVIIETAKSLRKQAEATVLFSLNPHVTLNDYLNLANGLASLGADVICFNDSFGVMNPAQVSRLVSLYRRYFHQPLRLHLHDNLQAAVASYQEGIRQGVEMVDTTLAALSWPYGPPSVESLMFSQGGSRRDPHIDLDVLGEITEYLDFLKEKYRYQPPARKLDDRLGTSYLPGPLKEFIREELKRQDARDRQQAAFKEAQQVWGDLGYPVLKGRILEIVGLQAVANAFGGNRYENLMDGMRDLLKGKYGRLLTPVKPELQWLALAGEKAPEPAVPEVEGWLSRGEGLETEEDILTASLFPQEAEAFFYARSQGIKPAPPAAPSPSPSPFLTPFAIADLILNRKGEEVEVRLEGAGAHRQGKLVLFLNIQGHIEAVELESVPGAGDEFLLTFHGDTYRLKISRTLPREQEYTRVLMEINGQIEEFLIKTPK